MTWKMKMQDVREEGWEEGREEGRGEGIQAVVNVLKQMNAGPEQIAQMLCEQFKLSAEEAAGRVNMYWEK